MNRRRFLYCLGCGGAAGLAGCAALPTGEKEVTMAASPQPQQRSDRPEWDVSVCGLNCARCRLLEQGRCGGCRGPLDRNWSQDCKFRPCAEGRGHRHCFECAAFPCKEIQAFASDGHEHHRLAVENLKRMKAVGLEQWVAEQPRPMFCPGWKF